MEWTQFIQYLSLAYLIYYGLNVIIDLLKPSSGKTLNGEDEMLEFSEGLEATLVEPFDEFQTNSVGQTHSEQSSTEITPEILSENENDEEMELFEENINVSTGGVTSMQELFKLAQNQSIEVRKQLVF